MPINLKQLSDGSMDLDGVDHSDAGFIPVSIPYNASSVDLVGFVATRSYRVHSIIWRVEVAGNDASAVTAIVKKAASGAAIASGTALHSSTANLKGTAATNQTLTLSTTDSDLTIPAGTAVGVDFTGTLTLATGVVTINLTPQ